MAGRAVPAAVVAGDGITLVDVLFRLLDSNGKSPPPLPLRRDNPLASLPLSARVAAALGGTARGLLGPLLPADPPSALKATDHRQVGTARRCATTARIPLEEVLANPLSV